MKRSGRALGSKAPLLGVLVLALALPATAAASGTLTFRTATFQAQEIEGKVTVVVDRDPTVDTATVNLSTVDGSAKAPGDYEAHSELLSFMPNEGTKKVELKVADDGVREPNETFTVKLSDQDPTSFIGGYGTASVLVVDSPGKASFDRETYTAGEGAGNAVVSLARTKGASGRLTVHYATSDGTAHAGARGDYTASSGSVTWEDGDASPHTFAIPIRQDAETEGPETINLTLTPDTSLTGALVSPNFSERPTAVLTVNDDDTPAIARLRGSDLFSLPSAKRCVKRRTLTIKPRNRRDVTLVQTEFRVADKLVRRVTAKKSLAKPVVLRRLPKSGRYAVQAVGLTSTGRTISIVRLYKPCR